MKYGDIYTLDFLNYHKEMCVCVCESVISNAQHKHISSNTFRTILNVIYQHISNILKTEMRNISFVEAIMLLRWTEHSPGGLSLLPV